MSLSKETPPEGSPDQNAPLSVSLGDARVCVDGGLGLAELGLAIWRFKWKILALMLLGALIGFAAGSAEQKRWQASALVLVGKVGQPVMSAQGPHRPSHVESPERAAERVLDPVFREALLAELGRPVDDGSTNGEARLIRQSLQVTIPRGMDLLEIRATAYSREAAREAVDSAVKLLAAAHEKLAEPSVERLRAQLQAVREQLGRLEAERSKLIDAARLQAGIGTADRFAESVLLGDILDRKEAEIRTLRADLLQLEEQLSPSLTYPTALLSAVHVPARHTYPKRSIFILAGAGLAGMLSLLWAIAVAVRGRSTAVIS